MHILKMGYTNEMKNTVKGGPDIRPKEKKTLFKSYWNFLIPKNWLHNKPKVMWMNGIYKNKFSSITKDIFFSTLFIHLIIVINNLWLTLMFAHADGHSNLYLKFFCSTHKTRPCVFEGCVGGQTLENEGITDC